MDDIGARTVFAVIFYLLGVDLAEIDCLMLRLDFSEGILLMRMLEGLRSRWQLKISAGGWQLQRIVQRH